jgi:hypothetical protein
MLFWCILYYKFSTYILVFEEFFFVLQRGASVYSYKFTRKDVEVYELIINDASRKKIEPVAHF